jgi:DNA-binding response OmpR family regulator
MASASLERILVVESDPDTSDLIGRQALQPLGYQVSIAADGANAIRQALQFQPDVMIIALNLQGLSGKDLLVALSSQGVTTPVIVLAQKGEEPAVIQAFRLGANDYLMLPAREAEVVSAVERTMKQVRESRARAKLDQQLKQTNDELQHRLRELTTIFSVGRAVISITDQRVLFEKIVEAVTTVTEADLGWLTLKDEKTKAFVLVSQLNLPDAWAKKIGQPLDDGVSSLVAMSAETLAIQGQSLQKFKISALGKSAMVVPVKVQNEAIGLLTVVRKAEKPFGESEQTLAGAIADYASISLVNARLFRALAHNAEAAQTGEKQKNEVLQTLCKEIQSGLQTAAYPLDLILGEKMGTLSTEQKQALESVQTAIKRLIALVSEQNTQPKPPV